MSSYPAVYCSSRNIDMLSNEDFFTFMKERVFLQHTIDNEVSTLARLTFYDNLFIVQEECPLSALSLFSRLNLEKMYGLSPETKKTDRNNEVYVISGCP